MDAELIKLERQVEQLIGLFEAGRAQTRELRECVARLEAENRILADKVAFATARLEAVLEKLPEG